MRGDGEDAVVVGRIEPLDLAAQPAPERFEACRPPRDRPGQRRQDAPASVEQLGAKAASDRNSRCRRPDAPARSGRGTAGAAPWRSITACFTEPTSDTMQPGFRLGAMVRVASPQAPTGVQTITRSASRRRRRGRCRNDRPASSWLAVSAVSARRVAATIVPPGRPGGRPARSSRRSGRCRSARSCRKAACPSTGPTRGLLDGGRAHRDERASEACTALTSASVPMVMRRCGQAVARRPCVGSARRSSASRWRRRHVPSSRTDQSRSCRRWAAGQAELKSARR